MTEIPAQTGTAVPDPRADHILITHTEASQPWHAQLRDGGNGREVWWNENYETPDGVRGAIAWLGRFVSPVNLSSVHWQTDSPFGELHVWLDDTELGDKSVIPIRYVDFVAPIDSALA